MPVEVTSTDRYGVVNVEAKGVDVSLSREEGWFVLQVGDRRFEISAEFGYSPIVVEVDKT